MSKRRREVPVPARTPARLRPQSAAEGRSGRGEGEHHITRRVPRSRGAPLLIPLQFRLSAYATPLQRHKLGSNLTPVTPESFAKWKKTRMDKKQAEDEAMQKAKNTQNAAGKNVGMSGRDLVRSFLYSTPSVLHLFDLLVLMWRAVLIQPRMVRGRGRWQCFRRLGPGSIQEAGGHRGRCSGGRGESGTVRRRGVRREGERSCRRRGCRLSNQCAFCTWRVMSIVSYYTSHMHVGRGVYFSNISDHTHTKSHASMHWIEYTVVQCSAPA